MKDKKIRKVVFFSVRVVRNFGFNKLESYANSLRSFRHLVYCKKKPTSMGVVGDCDASCASKKAYFFVSELEHFGNSRALLRSQVNNSVSLSVRLLLPQLTRRQLLYTKTTYVRHHQLLPLGTCYIMAGRLPRVCALAYISTLLTTFPDHWIGSIHSLKCCFYSKSHNAGKGKFPEVFFSSYLITYYCGIVQCSECTTSHSAVFSTISFRKILQ